MRAENFSDSKKTKGSFSSIRLAIPIFGATLTAIGVYLVYFFQYPTPAPNVPPPQPYQSLLVSGIISEMFGGFVLLVYFVWILYNMYRDSNKRLKRGEVLTVYDAMSLRVYYPPWLRWWIPLVPLVVFYFLGAAKFLSPAVAGILFFGYGGALIAYQYLYARRWLSRYQKR
jgi:hypothetical protein